MKPRSKPYALIAVLILCFTVVGYLNYKSSPVNNNPQTEQAQKPPDAAPQVGKTREATSKSSLVDAAKAGITKSGGQDGHMAMKMRDPEEIMATQPTKPSKPVKPKPSDSAVAGQWYSDNAIKDYSK